MFHPVSAESLGFDATRLARIHTHMQTTYVEQNKLPGVLTLVARHGKIAYIDVCGYQDIQTQTPLSEDSLFRIYSMSKPITSVAVMMLLEQGKLLLNDPVATYLPAFATTPVFDGMGPMGMKLTTQARPMTIRDLLTHTSGLSYGWYNDNPVEALYRQGGGFSKGVTLQSLVNDLAKLPLLFQPGTSWRYSLATDVLGHLVEVIADQPLDEFFKEQIFTPLDMVDSGFVVPEEKRSRFASMYAPVPEITLGIDSSTLTPEELFCIDLPIGAASYFEKPTLLSGGGGLVSTVKDYLHFYHMLLRGGELGGTRLLSPSSVALMSRNHIPKAQLPLRLGNDTMDGMGFGLGFGVLLDATSAGDLAPEGHYGWGGAASTNAWIDPKHGIIGLIMTQFMPSSFYPLGDEFRTLVYQALVT